MALSGWRGRGGSSELFANHCLTCSPLLSRRTCAAEPRSRTAAHTESHVQPVYLPYLTTCQGHRLCSTYRWGEAAPAAVWEPGWGLGAAPNTQPPLCIAGPSTRLPTGRCTNRYPNLWPRAVLAGAEPAATSSAATQVMRPLGHPGTLLTLLSPSPLILGG